jgi:hypothetical protein
LVGSLADGGEGDSAVERQEALFPYDRKGGVGRVPVARNVERIGERVWGTSDSAQSRGQTAQMVDSRCCACNRILMTSIGVTTATASVAPAPSPAILVSQHTPCSDDPLTQERPGWLDLAVLVRDQPLVDCTVSLTICTSTRYPSWQYGDVRLTLETGEPDGHLGDDTADDCSQAFIQSQRCLARCYLSACGKEAQGLQLRAVSIS